MYQAYEMRERTLSCLMAVSFVINPLQALTMSGLRLFQSSACECRLRQASHEHPTSHASIQKLAQA